MIPALPITGAAVLAPEPGGAQRITRIEPPARFSKAVLRRTSRLGQLALPVVEAALLQAESTAGPELGLVVGTGLADLDETIGFLQGVHERGERFASPQMFQRSVHSAVAGELAILYHLTGYNLTVTQGLASGEAALLAAALAVASGRCERCLCVAVDGVSDALLMALADLGHAPEAAGEGAAAADDEELDLGAPVLAVLTTAGDDPRSWLVAGETLARVLLRGRVDHLWASFLGQAIEVPTARAALRERLGLVGWPQLVLRLGYAGDRAPTPRRPLADQLFES